MKNRKHAAIICKSQNISIIEDTYLLAALLTFSPDITYQPIIDRDGNVCFEVHGSIADDMGRFYTGEAASLVTYIKNLKSLRSTIFVLKRSENQTRAVSGDDAGYTPVARMAR